MSSPRDLGGVACSFFYNHSTLSGLKNFYFRCVINLTDNFFLFASLREKNIHTSAEEKHNDCFQMFFCYFRKQSINHFSVFSVIYIILLSRYFHICISHPILCNAVLLIFLL